MLDGVEDEGGGPPHQARVVSVVRRARGVVAAGVLLDRAAHGHVPLRREGQRSVGLLAAAEEDRLEQPGGQAQPGERAVEVGGALRGALEQPGVGGPDRQRALSVGEPDRPPDSLVGQDAHRAGRAGG